MTYVNITALTFPEGAQAEIEKRFAARKRGVDTSQGFQGFELLRPVVGEDRYFVVTRWDTREDYERWRRGAARRRARGRQAPGHERGGPRFRGRPARGVTQAARPTEGFGIRPPRPVASGAEVRTREGTRTLTPEGTRT